MWSDQKSSLQLQKIFEISEIYSEKKTLQGYSPKKEKKKKNQTSANISKRAEKKYEYQTSLQSFEKVISKETRR